MYGIDMSEREDGDMEDIEDGVGGRGIWFGYEYIGYNLNIFRLGALVVFEGREEDYNSRYWND